MRNFTTLNEQTFVLFEFPFGGELGNVWRSRGAKFSRLKWYNYSSPWHDWCMLPIPQPQWWRNRINFYYYWTSLLFRNPTRSKLTFTSHSLQSSSVENAELFYSLFYSAAALALSNGYLIWTWSDFHCAPSVIKTANVICGWMGNKMDEWKLGARCLGSAQS